MTLSDGPVLSARLAWVFLRQLAARGPVTQLPKRTELAWAGVPARRWVHGPGAVGWAGLRQLESGCLQGRLLSLMAC